ncbi:MAG: hypothetical protein IBJ19_03950 [Gemmatimonadaceae bacterium]|nr:hypothetical protein [Gemmatimonadaceae bacterium]
MFSLHPYSTLTMPPRLLRTPRPRLGAALLLLGATSIAAQAQTLTPAPAGSRPAIRPLGPVTATSSEAFGVVSNLRALPGGRALVNDVVNRRVVLLDEKLSVVKVVADTTAATANAYGANPGNLIAFRGDSTLFVDAQSLSMLVIAPNGEVARVMSVPRSQDAMMLASAGLGGAYHSNGHLVYRGRPSMQFRASTTSGGPPQMPAMPDTMPVVRVNLQTRVLDTLAWMKVPNTRTTMNTTEDGKLQPSIEINPLPVVDEWTVTPAGDIAIVRGRDYHVDWVSANGEKRASPKVAFDWKRMTDEDKIKLIDSVKAIRERQLAANPGQGQDIARAFGSAMGGGAGGGGAAPQVVMRFEMRGDGGGPGGPVRAPQVVAPNFTYVSPSELPDYQPAFFANSLRADAEGRLWLSTIPTKPQPAGTVYDVLNAQGEAVERVLVPEGRSIVGFGPNGVVYLVSRQDNRAVLEVAKVNP